MNKHNALLKFWLGFACLVIVGCAPVNDDHIFQIGGKYSLEEFTLTFPTGTIFSFDESERAELDRIWALGNVDFDTVSTIGRTGSRFKYKLALSDGFVTEFDGRILTIDGIHYLHLSLLGDVGGFPGDVIPHVLRLDGAISAARITELFEMPEPKH